MDVEDIVGLETPASKAQSSGADEAKKARLFCSPLTEIRLTDGHKSRAWHLEVGWISIRGKIVHIRVPK
jgi:hypothetical protein